MFSFNHIRRWETHLACEIQVALNYMVFSVNEISVFNKYQNTRLAYAHVYIGWDTVPMNIPQKVIIVERQKCDTIPHNTLFMF